MIYGTILTGSMKNNTWCIDETVDEKKKTHVRELTLLNMKMRKDTLMGMQKKRIVKNIVRKNKEWLRLKEAEKTKSDFDRKKNTF